LKALGADASVDYKKSEEDQIAELISITEGKPTRIFDAVAQGINFAKAVFAKIPDVNPKYFSTTNDWYVLLSSHPKSLQQC
jgi:hypothetical protein